MHHQDSYSCVAPARQRKVKTMHRKVRPSNLSSMHCKPGNIGRWLCYGHDQLYSEHRSYNHEMHFLKRIRNGFSSAEITICEEEDKQKPQRPFYGHFSPGLSELRYGDPEKIALQLISSQISILNTTNPQ